MSTMTDAERDAYLRGFGLAQPPGSAELDALDRAKDFVPAGPGHLHLAISRDLAKAITAVVETLPEGSLFSVLRFPLGVHRIRDYTISSTRTFFDQDPAGSALLHVPQTSQLPFHFGRDFVQRLQRLATVA